MHMRLLLIALAGLLGDRCEHWSVHPVYEERDLVTDPRLPGTWYGTDGHWVVDSVYGKAYRAIYVHNGDTAEYRLHLARAEGLLLADLERLVDDGVEVLPLHQYAVLQLADSVLGYAWLEDEWLKQYIDAHPKELAVEIVDGAHLITAPPRAIQRFLRRHRGDSAAWMSTALTRWRIEE